VTGFGQTKRRLRLLLGFDVAPGFSRASVPEPAQARHSAVSAQLVILSVASRPLFRKSRLAIFGRDAKSKNPSSFFSFCLPMILASSILSVSATHGVQQLLRVVTDSILENDLALFDIRNLSGRITLHHNKIRVFSN